MAEPLAGSRGPLGNLAVDLTKHLALRDATGAPSPGLIEDIKVYNDWGGELQLSHARMSLAQGGIAGGASDGTVVIDFVANDTTSVLPPDQFGDPIPATYAVLPATTNGDPVSIRYQFPAGSFLADGDTLGMNVISAPGAPDGSEASFLSVTVYAFPTGR